MSKPTSKTTQPSVLVVDDDRGVRTALEINLGKAGWAVCLAQTGEDAISVLREQSVDVILTDLMMPGMSGMDLLAQIRQSWPTSQVVLMTGHGTVERAVEAMRLGANDFIIKPIRRAELIAILERALREKNLVARVEHLEAETAARFGFEKLVGNTPAMEAVYEQVAAVAQSDALVLLTGPTGTGKELLAHAIHYRSQRRSGNYLQVNCGALPSGLLESELFGHERGAFTGAIRQHKGKFEQADGGTLLLDEIGEIPLETQVKLLRIIESGRFQRLGGTQTLQTDVRVIAATNKNLEAAVRVGDFRKDLYYRIDVFRIVVPPLRERRADIPLLVDHFITQFAKHHDKPARAASDEAMASLQSHNWPGNVRELEHVVERAVILCPSETISRFRLSRSLESPTAPDGGMPPEMNIHEALRERERTWIIAALRLEDGVQARAARRLGVSRANLNYRIQKLGIIVKDIAYK